MKPNQSSKSETTNKDGVGGFRPYGLTAYRRADRRRFSHLRRRGWVYFVLASLFVAAIGITGHFFIPQ